MIAGKAGKDDTWLLEDTKCKSVCCFSFTSIPFSKEVWRICITLEYLVNMYGYRIGRAKH
jgi:hypothetical protein